VLTTTAGCGHSEATCHGPVCLKEAPRPAPPPEIGIEQRYDDRMARARADYHLKVQQAEDELDAALAEAESERAASLCALRHTHHPAA
jgi:hypothetical protein